MVPCFTELNTSILTTQTNRRYTIKTSMHTPKDKTRNTVKASLKLKDCIKKKCARINNKISKIHIRINSNSDGNPN